MSMISCPRLPSLSPKLSQKFVLRLDSMLEGFLGVLERTADEFNLLARRELMDLCVANLSDKLL